MKNGFTIIEFLIYIVILVMAITSINLISINIFHASARTNTIQEVAHNGRFVMHKIKEEIKNSTSIVYPETEGEELRLLSNDSLVVFKISENEKRLVVEKNNISIYLTTSKVEIDSVRFKIISNDSIKVEIKISHKNDQNLPEQEFENLFISSFVLN
ncbi:MAG: hypothetical protein PHI45_02490 [Candidatus Pacebacteria bacterium]|nr:hypothetical protein [Candidatus Paceibacterota bacterium]